MNFVASIVCIALIALVPAVYSQRNCGTVCCDYDYKASNESCCKYWVCANGVETEMRCPGGLHWNEVAKTCDWPSSAKCSLGGGGGVVTDEPGSTTTEEVTTTPEDVTTTPEEVTTTPEEVTTTPEEVTTTPEEVTTTTEEVTTTPEEVTTTTVEVTTTPEEVTTTPEEVTTTPEEVTTTTEEVTTTPEEVTTTPEEVTTTPAGETTTTGCGSVCECTSGEYQPLVGEACKYQVCDNGKWTTMSCPGGLVWNDILKTCAWQACDNCGECTPGQYEAVVGEACKFKVCEHGSWTTMSCPSGLIWDNTQKACAGVQCDSCTTASPV